jgi:riboflavin kinase/FMN adenylyltransferase
MELIRGRHNIRARHRGCVATIGNFDGVHRGHQALLAQLREAALRRCLPSTVIVFEPQPSEYLRPETAPARLTRLREKHRLLAVRNIDRLLVLRFDAALAGLSAEAFVREILVERLGVTELVVGDNFRFGRGRGGDYAALEHLAADHGFSMARAEPVCVTGERVSSTRIRTLLWAGELDTAATLLGRRYGMSGRVVYGEARGRTIGYPTINVGPHRQRSPLAGIFAVRVYGLGSHAVCGAGYVGTRPVAGGDRTVLEVHLFEYDADCYGAHVEVEFVQKLREERPFESFEALRDQIAVDSAAARRVLMC